MRVKPMVAVVALVLLGMAAAGRSQPLPGDVFRKHTWWNEKDDGWDYRVAVRVNAAGFEREARVMEVPLDLTQLLGKLGRTAPGSDPAIRVLEVDAAGRVLHEVVPVQFDKDPNYNPQTALRGVLTFMLSGQTAARAERVFHVYFDFKPHGATARSIPTGR
jgi:hypothetical protein